MIAKAKANAEKVTILRYCCALLLIVVSYYDGTQLFYYVCWALSQKFEARCKLLAAFVQENGHCNVPTYSNEEKKKLPREIDAGLG